METRGGRIEGAVQRLLEGPKSSAPETPLNKLFSEVTAGSHPQDEVQREKTFVPSRELLEELEALTVEAGPTLEILKEQACGSQINGAVLEAAAVAQPRMEAIKWMSNQFAAFGYRDEWLADAILYMDRLAVQMYKSDNFLSLGVEPNSPAAEILGATEAMKSQDLWLAAVMVALKMSEAESELDTSIQDLVVPLVPFGPNGLKCTRARWQKIKLTEFFVVRELDSRLMVPTALHFVQHLSREVQRAAPANWPGLESVELPKLLGPPLSSKEQEEQKQKNAMPLRRLTKMQALAQCLADMAVVHKPSNVYGDKLSPAVLAVTVLRLCLYGWGCPPAGCEERLDELQEELGINSVPEEERQRLLAEVFRLWQRMPVGLLSPVTDRWRKRDLLGKLPPAPGQDSLPPLLQECCCFLTPRKKKQEPKDLSATPGSRPVQEDLASTNKAVDLPGTVPQSPEVRELFRDMPGVPAIPCMSGVPPVPVPAADDEALPAVDAAELAADPPVGEAMPVVVEENAASEPAMDVDDEVGPLLPLPEEKEDLETPQAAPEVPEEDDKHHPADLAAVRTSQPSEPIEVDDAEEVAFASAPAPAPASAPTLAQPTSRGTLSLVPFAKNRPGKSGSLGALAAVAATKALPKQETAGSNVWAPLDRIHEELGQPRQPMAPPAVSAPSTKAAQAMPGDAQKLAAPVQAKQVFPANSQSRKVAKAAKVKAKSTHARGRIGRLYRSPSGLSGHSSDTTFSPGPEESLPPPTVKKAPRKTKKRKKILQANPNLKKYKTPAAPMQVIPQTNLIRDAGQPFWTNRNVQPQHQVLQPANPAPAEPAVQAVPALMGGRPAAEISRSRSGSDFARKMQKSQALSRKSRFEAALKGEDTQEIEEALADLEGEPSYFEDKEKADLRIQELEEFLERKLERATQGELVKGANLISQWRKHEERRSLERVMQSRANRQVMTLD
mmetsp:Transcript_61824/g.135400  ORF Transcript_61824/g.135400 Transcript_61824/m.135400 type:complete len:955 (+) Transcript_61824:42-2906(+)